MDMRSPLLSHRAEISEIDDAPRHAMPPTLLLRPKMGYWRASKQKRESMPSDEQQYWKNPCIFSVPAFITKLKPEAYEPHVVSFGPYHHGKDHLLPMEFHKRRARDHFLERVKQSGKSLEPFFESLMQMAPALTESYDVLNPEWKEGTVLLELMITDGCFMLEIMRATIEKEKNDYACDDPIFSTHRLAYITPYIRRDMLVLENQLPMLVLYRMVALENNGREDDVNELVLKFCDPLKEIKKNHPYTKLGRRLHVLDVFREGLLMEPGKDQQKNRNGDKSSFHTGITGMGHVVDIFKKCLPKEIENVQHERIIWSAIELDEAGIQFNKSKTSSLKDISFAGGVLKLPGIMVDDTIESMFLNVMTFERLHIGTGNEVTSYVVFMDNIINNEQDVALLHAQCIIQNAIGSNEAVKELFNSLCREVTLASNNSLDTVQKEISKYCEQKCNGWRANLKRTYFKNPWTVLSLTAAIFLFVLTAIQTVYTVLSYY